MKKQALTTEPSARKKELIDTDMVSKEQASNRKLGTKFDLIKTVVSLTQAQKPGSSTHYESLLQQRQSGKCVVRKRDEGYDSPFDDEGDFDKNPPLPVADEEMDAISISNFSKRYMSQHSTNLGE